MIIIYKNLIDKYINYLTIDHVKNYAKNKNILLSDEELNIIYSFIMNNYKNLINDDNTIYKLKPLLRNDLFENILSLYIENKAKYL